jgi:hypothetical protein
MPDIREDFGHSCFILGLLPSGLIRGLSDAPDRVSPAKRVTPLGDHKCRAISLSVVRIAVTPVPVIGLVPGVQLNESPFFVALGLIPLVRAVFVGVPVVIVLVALVVITLVVLAFSVFVVPIVLRGSGHHCNRCRQGSSQKKRTEKSVSRVHVVLLWG